MSGTLLEQTRSAHEELERLERVVVKDLQQDAKTHKEKLFQNHRVSNFLNQMQETTKRLSDIYEDKDHARRDEIAAIGGQPIGGQNVFSAFYDRLKEIRDYHRRNPGARDIEPPEDPEELIKEEPYIEFAGEEALGKYVDLHELHQKFVNSSFGRQMEYSAYLEEFVQTQTVPRHSKLGRAYKEYIGELVAYLQSFMERTQPLQDTRAVLDKVDEEFEERWGSGAVQGWEDRGLGGARAGSVVEDVLVDLDVYDTVELLVEEVGAEKLKEALAALGLKTGGTPRERAERLLLTKDTPLEDLDPRHFQKGKGPTTKSLKPVQLEQAREVARLESKLRLLCHLMTSAIRDTREHVERKQSRTAEEMEQDREEEDVEAESESDDDEAAIYNPLKLPMGWDGKPIPYWLYKLHGLNQEFKCEICGNYSYWGRRAFERHFKEWRHQHGMRCLGIPNTKNFNEVTIIKDAQDLWEKIQERQGTSKWKPELEEEYEDQEGNVYNKKTFTDLQRQGLI